MKFDDILTNYIGEFGRYQILQFILVCIPTIFTAMHALSWTFTGSVIPYRCLVIGENDTDSFPFIPNDEAYRNWVTENKTDGPPEIREGCRRPKGTSVYNNWSMPEHITEGVLEECDGGGLYKWDYSEISDTAITRWEIVCSRKWIRAFVQAMYYVGQFFGSLVFGILADKYGRKKVFFSAIILQVTCGAIMAFVPWWPLFAILRIGVGFAHPGIFLIAVVIGMELVGPSRRVVAGVATGIFFAIGQIVLGTLAYNIRYYYYLQLAVSLPALIFIGYWWIVPESARWLISQKRYQEADKILQQAAKFNKKTLPANWYEQLDEESKPAGNQVKKYGFFDLFKTPNIRKRSCIAAFICWPTVSMAYYGLSMNPNFLGGDRYVTFLIGAFLELPAMVIVLFTMNILGRKTLCLGGFLSAAICLLITLTIPTEYPTLLSIMVVLGKMSLTAVYAIIYVYTPELFPTVIRSTAMGTCSMVARVGAVSASFLAMWLATTNPGKIAVVLIFGGLCLVAGASTLFLPETTGQTQFETIEDAEKFGRNQPLFVFSFRAKNNQLKVTRDGNDTQEALMHADDKSKAL